jgi:hypothetical protein
MFIQLGVKTVNQSKDYTDKILAVLRMEQLKVKQTVGN